MDLRYCYWETEGPNAVARQSSLKSHSHTCAVKNKNATEIEKCSDKRKKAKLPVLPSNRHTFRFFYLRSSFLLSDKVVCCQRDVVCLPVLKILRRQSSSSERHLISLAGLLRN